MKLDFASAMPVLILEFGVAMPRVAITMVMLEKAAAMMVPATVVKHQGSATASYNLTMFTLDFAVMVAMPVSTFEFAPVSPAVPRTAALGQTRTRRQEQQGDTAQ